MQSMQEKIYCFIIITFTDLTVCYYHTNCTRVRLSPSSIHVFVCVVRDIVNNTVSSSLLEGVQSVLQVDGITEVHDDELTVSKKVEINDIATCSVYAHHTVL